MAVKLEGHELAFWEAVYVKFMKTAVEVAWPGVPDAAAERADRAVLDRRTRLGPDGSAYHRVARLKK